MLFLKNGVTTKTIDLPLLLFVLSVLFVVVCGCLSSSFSYLITGFTFLVTLSVNLVQIKAFGAEIGQTTIKIGKNV